MRALAVAVAACLLLLTAPPAHAADDCWRIGWRCRQIKTYRADHGRAPLHQSAALQRQAKAWARHMADTRTLSHSWQGSEIVGMAPDWRTVMVAWDHSSCVDGTWPECPGHRELLLDRSFDRLGIGVARSGGLVYAVVRFE